MNYDKSKFNKLYPPHIFGEPNIYFYHNEDINYHYLVAKDEKYILDDITIDDRFILTNDLNIIIEVIRYDKLILQIKDFVEL